MCGIAGLFHLHGRAVDVAQLRALADTLRHRGPDDEGYALFHTATGAAAHFKGPDSPAGVALPDVRGTPPPFAPDLALAERRLAILDLSPAGHTPMTTADGALTVCFNGEIFNYLELRAELRARGHAFRSSGDTEVLLAAYREWGPDCVQHFNGMWAFALWDAGARRLLCARDRFGVKPFYYVLTDGLFAFASEPKALWSTGLVQPRPNEPLLVDFLAGYEASQLDQTLLAEIRQLPGAHTLTVTADGLQIRPYWELPCNPELGPETPDPAQAQRLRELLTDAVRLRLRSDVPVGTCLSGGLDSSAIVVLANQLMQDEHNVPRALVGEHQKTFTAAYDDPESDERAFARLIVDQTGAEWHQTFPTAETLAADLERFFWHHDEPPITTSMYAQWCVMRLARAQGVTVTLDGQGSDELLAGYLPYDIYLGQLLRAGQWPRLAREANAIAAVGARPLGEVLARTAARQLPAAWQRQLQARRAGRMPGLSAEAAQAAIQRHALNFDAAGQANLPRHLNTLARHNLPRLLRSEDRNAMAFSIEARTPFLDVRVAEYVAQLPAGARIHQGWSKHVLRQALHGQLPDAITWRRDKKGFATPERAWLRALHPTLAALFQDTPRAAAYLDLAAVRQTLQSPAYTQDAPTAAAVWRWAAAELWLRMLAR